MSAPLPLKTFRPKWLMRYTVRPYSRTRKAFPAADFSPILCGGSPFHRQVAYSASAFSELNGIRMFNSSRRALRTPFVVIFLVGLASQSALATPPEKLDGDIADLSLSGCDAGSASITVPKEIEPFVPSDFTAMEWHKVDLNLDGRPDYYLVVEHECDDRTLLLITRGADGTLSVAASNSNLIVPRSGGGQYGGYTGADIHPGRFTIKQEVGSAAGGTSEMVTFSWSKKKQTWIVTAYHDRSCDREMGCESYPASKELGLSIQEYSSQGN